MTAAVPGLDDGGEGLEVVGEPPSGIDLFASVGEVGVLPVLLRTATREVLRGAGDAARPERPSAGTLRGTRWTSSVTSPGSCPKVPACLAQRGSVARSSVGCRAARMPTATYSCRAMSANSRTASASRSAASPSGSGHWEKAFAVNETPAFSMNACRGSVEMVTGMPCGVRSASAWRALCHRAAIRASSRTWTLKWVRCLSSTTTLVGRLADPARRPRRASRPRPPR